jgi:hypothetical protein
VPTLVLAAEKPDWALPKIVQFGNKDTQVRDMLAIAAYAASMQP